MQRISFSLFDIMGPKSPPGSKSFREGIHFYNHQNYEEALIRWEKASSLNNIEAILRAADLYNEGKERLPRDPTKAIRLYKKAAYLYQNTLAQYKIGLMYFLGDGVQQSFEHAFNYFQLAANDNYSGAELALAHMYYTGQGVEKDFHKAHRYYLKMNGVKRHLGMAKLYHHGHGSFLPNARLALDCYKNAAVGKEPDALYELGCIYKDGILGVEREYMKAMEYFSVAASQSHVDSIANIGLLFFYGLGVKEDFNHAYLHFDRALRLDKEHGLANFYTGKCIIARNPSVPASVILDHYIKAAYSHYSRASFAIGRYYETGLGEGVDIEKAIKWYQRAVDDGPNADAEAALRRLKPTTVAAPTATVVESKPDAVEHTPVQSPTINVLSPGTDVESKPMAENEEAHNKMRLLSLKLKQKLDLSEKERLRIEQELKEKDELNEKERLRTEQELKEKDEKIRLLTIEKDKMQKFQMQLVLSMTDEKDQSNKRKRYTID